MRNSGFSIATAMLLSGSMAAISCTHPGPPAPAVSFRANIMPIIRTSCSISSNCHIGSFNANGHIDLSDSIAYNTIISGGLVNTQLPNNSLLYSELVNGYMPKAPYGKLSGGQINLILDWIKQGAKNN